MGPTELVKWDLQHWVAEMHRRLSKFECYEERMHNKRPYDHPMQRTFDDWEHRLIHFLQGMGRSPTPEGDPK